MNIFALALVLCVVALFALGCGGSEKQEQPMAPMAGDPCDPHAGPPPELVGQNDSPLHHPRGHPWDCSYRAAKLVKLGQPCDENKDEGAWSRLECHRGSWRFIPPTADDYCAEDQPPPEGYICTKVPIGR